MERWHVYVRSHFKIIFQGYLPHTHTHTLTHKHKHTDAQAVSSINRAVESNDPAATLEAIKAPTTNIRSITDSCTDTYLEKLSAARQEKVDKGVCVCMVCVRVNRE